MSLQNIFNDIAKHINRLTVEVEDLKKRMTKLEELHDYTITQCQHSHIPRKP